MDALRQAYGRLQAGLPEMRAGSYIATTQDFESDDALWAALADAVPVEGWLLFQSHRLAFRNGLPERNREWGWLLEGEVVDARGDSFRVEYHGQWRLARLIHQEGGDGLYDTPAHLAHDPRLGRLRYRRYWVRDDEQGLVQA
ncbi:MAG: hypothetical protein D6751_03285, partial [Deltaproteobacteria bacterium]